MRTAPCHVPCRSLALSAALARSLSVAAAASAAIAHLSRVAAVRGGTKSTNFCVSGGGLISDSVNFPCNFRSAIFRFASFPPLVNPPPNSLQHPARNQPTVPKSENQVQQFGSVSRGGAPPQNAARTFILRAWVSSRRLHCSCYNLFSPQPLEEIAGSGAE